MEGERERVVWGERGGAKMSEEKKPNWLITGGCGFIGTDLIEHLLLWGLAGHIRVLDNLSVGTRKDLADVIEFREFTLSEIGGILHEEVELVVGNVYDYTTVDKCSRGMDVIVHLAASTGVAQSVENPLLDFRNNVLGTFNVLEAARCNGVGRVVYASSGAVLGEASLPAHEAIAPKPVAPYGASKLAGEGYCSAYARVYGIKTASLRFANVYGPRSHHKTSAVAKFFTEAFAGRPIVIYGDGEQTRDFIYVEDLSNAIILASDAPVGGEAFQIATCKETPIIEVAEKVKNLMFMELGKRVEIGYCPARRGDVRQNYADNTKARTVLGFEPNYDLVNGLKRTFSYFKKLAIPYS